MDFPCRRRKCTDKGYKISNVSKGNHKENTDFIDKDFANTVKTDKTTKINRIHSVFYTCMYIISAFPDDWLG